jgi:formylglycine-generating enzyme
MGEWMTVALAILGGLASLIGVYEALTPPERSLYRLVTGLGRAVRRTPEPEIQALIDKYEMQRISNGSFLMGTDARLVPSQKGFSDELPQHRVTISTDFLAGKHPVTQQLWEAVMGTGQRSRYRVDSGPHRPIVGISWYEAVRFCNEMSSHAELTPAYAFSDPFAAEPAVSWDRSADGFRLPTEAEWEFFTRAGTSSPFWSGHTPKQLQSSEWTGDNTTYLRDVGTKRANPWGLYDTNGLIGEWCWDWYGPYPDDEVTDPAGPATGGGRVWRAGKWVWKDRPEYYRSADRDLMLPVNNDPAVGFRVVRSIAE